MTFVAAALLAPPSAFAAGDAVAPAARQLVEGQKAFGAGDYRRAADLFEGAYKDKPHHSALWNAARSWQRAGEEVRAANLYARFLLEAPANAPDRDQANVAVKELATRLGRIEAHAATGVTNPRLDGQAVEAPVVYVAVGEHLAEADSSGGPVRKVVRVERGQVVAVTLEPPPPPGGETVPPPVPRPAEPPSKPLPPVVFFAAAGLSLVAGGLAVASGLDTVDKRDAFLGDPTQERLDAGFASQSRTNVAIGVSAGLAVVTAAVGVFFTEWRGKRNVGTSAGGWAF